MKILIIANSFIVKESIANIFKKVYTESEVTATHNINDLSTDEINLYDIILVNTVNNDLEYINKAVQLKNEQNKVIILDQLQSESTFNLCIENDVDGYVVDFDDEYEFKYVIDKIINGKKFYDSNISQKILNNKLKIKIKSQILTSREEEIRQEVGNDFSNKEIADKLGITEFTVKKHMSSILHKLNFKSRKDIIRYSREK